MHEMPDPVAARVNAFPDELAPDLLHAVHPEVPLMDALDDRLQYLVASLPGRRRAGLRGVVG
jgi:hypothetical protein